VAGAVVVGTGFGCRVHVPALRAAGFEVLGLVGRDREKTQRRATRLQIPHAFGALEEALALPGVDAVTIATPPHTHAALAIEACAAGRHVICEKPFALDAGEAVAMCDAALAAGVTALVGHEFRWAEDRAVARRAIADGVIGTPRTCSLVQYVPLVADPATPMPEWWFDADRGGGWLGASGSHIVDQIRTWLGEFASVSAALPLVSDRTGVAEDSFVVRFTLANGVEGVMQQTAASWIPDVLGCTIVAGTRGTLHVDGREVWCADRDGRRRLEVPDDLRLHAPPESDDPRERFYWSTPAPPPESAPPSSRFTHLELGPYTRLCEVLHAATTGGVAAGSVPIPTFADGLASMRVLDAIRDSARAAGATVAIG
jgi:predicted dehydrogenase